MFQTLIHIPGFKKRVGACPAIFLYSITMLEKTIAILPAYTRYRLVGKVHPPLVSNVEQVARAGQLHLRKGRL